ncbi:hypothetical protein VP01_1379g1 [Puccinia sorghi]|uniref:Uncharacterized protein n=1 Tax=Puccinia sorghi TaxID=27349 RepID=A0A0L6VNB8_9BASI|nr:hypothetical protein VP01_1379g1 [Puccinia sorghi]
MNFGQFEFFSHTLKSSKQKDLIFFRLNIINLPFLGNLTHNPHLCTTNWFCNQPGPAKQSQVGCRSKEGHDNKGPPPILPGKYSGHGETPGQGDSPIHLKRLETHEYDSQSILYQGKSSTTSSNMSKNPYSRLPRIFSRNRDWGNWISYNFTGSNPSFPEQRDEFNLKLIEEFTEASALAVVQSFNDSLKDFSKYNSFYHFIIAKRYHLTYWSKLVLEYVHILNYITREDSLAQEDLLASLGRAAIQRSILQSQAMTMRTSQGSSSLLLCIKRLEKYLKGPSIYISTTRIYPSECFSKSSSVLSPLQFSSQNPFNCSETLPAGFTNQRGAINPCGIFYCPSILLYQTTNHPKNHPPHRSHLVVFMTEMCTSFFKQEPMLEH